MTEISSTRNPLVQRARLLARDRSERAESGLAVLEGVRLAEEAVAAHVAFEYVLWSDALIERERGAAVLEALRGMGVQLHHCTADVLARAADTQAPQGLVGVFRPRVRSLRHIDPGLVLVLDGLQDPGNLGTVIRSAEALGAAGVVVAGGVDAFNPKVVRGAMGSLFRLPVVSADLQEVLSAFREQGRPIYVADSGGRLQPWEVALSGSAVLVVGSEAHGPSETARNGADALVSIPMPGGVESLNAGVAASLLLYEALRQRLAAPGASTLP